MVENLTLLLHKCVLATDRVNYPGHILMTDRVQPGQNELSMIETLVIPILAFKIKRYLGLKGILRRLVRHCASITVPLHYLQSAGSNLFGLRKRMWHLMLWSSESSKSRYYTCIVTRLRLSFRRRQANKDLWHYKRTPMVSDVLSTVWVDEPVQPKVSTTTAT